jgi:hypothetical protein
MTEVSSLPGVLLFITGLLHTLVAIFSPHLGPHLYSNVLAGGPIIGMWKLSKAEDGTIGNWENFGAAWFFLAGPLMMMLGWMMYLYVRDTKRCTPSSIGFSLIISGVIGCIAFPISGFWLLWPQGCYIVFSTTQEEKKD